MPPRLKKPWKPDIIGLPAAFSTSTACTFIATSSMPSPAPKTISVAAIIHMTSSVASSGSIARITSVEPNMTRRQPNRATSAPVTGIAASEPMPRQSSSAPSDAPLSASR